MAQGMTFGFIYDLRNPPEWRRPWPSLYAETLDFIALTESLGFDAAWLPEHHADGDGYLPSPLVALAAVAARTKTIRIGSAVALPTFYHPVRFAEDAAVVDILSGGRLEIGVAIGYRQRETDAYGVDFRSRISRLEEFVGIVRRLWQGETFSHQGKHFALTNATIMPRPVRGHIPLLIGGFSEKALDRVARLGDAYMGMPELGEVYLEKLRAHGKDVAAARIYVPSLNIVVSENPGRTMDELAPYYHYVNNAYGRWLTEDQYDARIPLENAPQTMTLDQFKASGLLQVMTPAQTIEMFRAMRAQAPVEHVMITVPSGVPLDRYAPYAELFAKEVMPALQ